MMDQDQKASGAQATSTASGSARPAGILDPLREKTYRTIWIASLLSNLGQLIQGVGAAWEMTRLSNSVQMVALVQTAVLLPLMLVSLPAGAIADMFDRRKVALAGLAFACASAVVLTIFAFAGLITPWLLLAFCFLVGSGVALYGPAWQSSIAEQVPQRHLPSAIALGSISYNIARSFGPAIGGIVVAAFGAVAAFGLNALLYLPTLAAFYFWRRPHMPSRLPRERIDRAIVSGLRYVFYSPPLRIIMIRTLVTGMSGAAISALMPLVARDILGGGADVYGILLGAFGVGAVLGALLMSWARTLPAETAVRFSTLISAAMFIIVGVSHNLILSCAALVIGGAAWMLLIAMFNVGVQLSAPRWVTARALACFQSAITGGMAFGAWGWGSVASHWGTGTALVASGILVGLTPLLGRWLPTPRTDHIDFEPITTFNEPEVALDLTPRSGPVIIELAYRVETDNARDFYGAMQKVRSARLRTGAYEWTLSRDIADPQLWTERFHYPTWGDYLRQRSRRTQADLQVQEEAEAFHIGPTSGRVRRRLERPFGSVRWRADTPDLRDESIRILPP